MSDPVLAISDLEVRFRARAGVVEAVRGVSLSVARGETLAIVGESGSGKSVTALAAMGLIKLPGEVTGGRIRFGGQDMTGADEPAWRRLRGRRIAMIFQDPMTSLNPLMTIGAQITESLRTHLGLDAAAARRRARALIEMVGLSAPEKRLDQRPHELSGGMRQRVMIALALACEPDLLIADEPTTALDVTIQAQILEMLAELQARLGLSMLMITHDLGVVAATCRRVAVMYAGRIVEEADVDPLFADPRHPYTQGLLRATPRLDGTEARLTQIDGAPPDMKRLPAGCAFAARCPAAEARCRAETPPLAPDVNGRKVACWRPGVRAFESPPA
jgi:peptide/nickel transport system ATP-binding protein